MDRIKESALEIFAGAKYYVTPKGKKGPSIYREKEVFSSGEKEFTVWDSDRKIPFLLAYDQYISREEFEQLSVEKRQQILVEAVVLEQSPKIGKWKEASSLLNDAKAAETIWTFDDKIELEENTIQVKERGGTLNIQADIPEEGEVYLIFEGIDYEDHSMKAISRTNTNIRVDIASENLNKNIVIRNKSGFGGSNRKNDFLCNLELNGHGKKNIEIKFPYAGVYRYKDIRVVVQPMERMRKYVEKLEKGIEGGVHAVGNTVKASLKLAEPRLVCLTIPFDKGWKAIVDGKETELMQADIMYMMLPLEEGEHEIELCYSNPFINIGMVLSVIGIVGAIICIAGNNVKRKKQGE